MFTTWAEHLDIVKNCIMIQAVESILSISEQDFLHFKTIQVVTLQYRLALHCITDKQAV